MNGDDIRMFGMLPFTTRMTVVQLESGGVWLHSPVRPTPERRRAVDQLGPVEHLVAPNKIHSLGIEPWKVSHPSAKVWTSPGFNRRHADIAVDAVLTNDVQAPWSGEINHCVIDGHAVLDEVEFLHKPSRTLIITDLIQKHEAAGESWDLARRQAHGRRLGRGRRCPCGHQAQRSGQDGDPTEHRKDTRVELRQSHHRAWPLLARRCKGGCRPRIRRVHWRVTTKRAWM